MYRQYYLNITNDDGLSNSLQFQLISETVPDSPQGITLISKTTDTICIEWTPGFNGGALWSFIVQHSTDDKTWVNSSTIPDGSNNGRVDYCIEGLEPDTSYYIRVIASNKYGESLISTLFERGHPKTAPRQGSGFTNDYNSGYNSGIGAGIGIGLSLAIALVVMVIMSIYIYRYWTGKRQKSDQTYDSFNTRTRADDTQTYQELDTIPNTNSPQTNDMVHYNNTEVNQRRRGEYVTPYYANLRSQTRDDTQTYQELDTIPNTNSPQTNYMVHYNNTEANHRRRDEYVTPYYANLRSQTRDKACCENVGKSWTNVHSINKPKDQVV
ncbi:hypothetical protein LOTGIDRAFT_158037 [Lottia gigantea]|uniref:Fibronectin type-III domain-containing protein n=1 Tax=Lottia gigantea TaxID=225164 RepID=V4B0X4_LOTGI|nr:hypothetical protein LOTGIDRAFT_158037 [Lottia gigantea]ESO99881.1 hypothetical protein LOTGIDRAFT_158037 [Lottia gigantea]